MYSPLGHGLWVLSQGLGCGSSWKTGERFPGLWGGRGVEDQFGRPLSGRDRLGVKELWGAGWQHCTACRLMWWGSADMTEAGALRAAG